MQLLSGMERQKLILQSMMDRPRNAPDTPTKKHDPRSRLSSESLPPTPTIQTPAYENRTQQNNVPLHVAPPGSSSISSGISLPGVPSLHSGPPMSGAPPLPEGPSIPDSLMPPLPCAPMSGSSMPGLPMAGPISRGPMNNTPSAYQQGFQNKHSRQYESYDNYNHRGENYNHDLGYHKHYNNARSYGSNHHNNSYNKRYRDRCEYDNGNDYTNEYGNDYGSFGHAHRKQRNCRYEKEFSPHKEHLPSEPHIQSNEPIDNSTMPLNHPLIPLDQPPIPLEQPPIPLEQPPIPDSLHLPPEQPHLTMNSINNSSWHGPSGPHTDTNESNTSPPIDAPRQMSLDSRIKLLMQTSEMQMCESADSQEEEEAPPLPPSTDEAPPLPPSHPPPPPHVEQDRLENDDDRMSISSGEDIDPNITKWSQNFRNNLSSTSYIDHNINPMTPADEHQEIVYDSALDSLVEQLRDIVTKDLTKKMVQNSAFSLYDNWWTREQERHKVCRLLILVLLELANI